MIAVGGYLRGLRGVKDLTQTQVAAEVGRQLKRDVQPTTIWRIETARTIPKTDMLLAMLAILGGSVADLVRLNTQDNATAEDGLLAARDWFNTSAAAATPAPAAAVATATATAASPAALAAALNSATAAPIASSFASLR